MLGLLGEWSLCSALFFALLQSVLPLVGYWRNNPYLLAVARPAALGQWACIIAAYVLLTIAFVTSDFSIAYVAANSHPSLPFMYQLTALWGAHEGSILLWILILSTWTIIFSALQKQRSSAPLVIGLLGIISICFLCFLLLTSNPFLAATGIQTGMDLNPLLQDPGFVIHPPMLYTGYVGFSVAFAITLAALLRGNLDKAWATTTRQFALAAWCFLTLGITLGSWWAYRVLGWGGFWFWDPVENASLLPWLSGIALIHVLRLVEKRDIAQSWAAILGLITFALSLLGTFLVRSGVLISAHTFANDPARGVFLLILLTIVVTAALAIYIIRIPACAKSEKPYVAFTSREMALLFNSALFTIAMATVLLGTIYPLLLDALHLGTISVGAPYFNTVMLPLALITMLVMGAGPFCAWMGQARKKTWLQVAGMLLTSAVISFAGLWYFTHALSIVAGLTLTLSLWIIIGATYLYRRHIGMSIAHAGFAMLVIGVILSGVLTQEREVRIQPGNVVTLGPYQFLFIDTQGVSGSNYRGIRAAFEVTKNTRHVVNLYPEKRIYTVRDMIMTTVAIHPGIFRDLYIALGEPLNENYWSARIYYKPFIRWIWFGGALMMIGGLLAITRRTRG